MLVWCLMNLIKPSPDVIFFFLGGWGTGTCHIIIYLWAGYTVCLISPVIVSNASSKRTPLCKNSVHILHHQLGNKSTEHDSLSSCAQSILSITQISLQRLSLELKLHGLLTTLLQLLILPPHVLLQFTKTLGTVFIHCFQHHSNMQLETTEIIIE